MLAGFGHGGGPGGSAIAVDDQARIGLQDSGRVQRGRQVLGDLCDANVPGDMALHLRVRDTKPAECRRDGSAGVIGGEEQVGSTIFPQYAKGRGVVGGEQFCPHRGRGSYGIPRRMGYRCGMDKEAKRAHHDLGGASKFMCEPVDIEPHGLTAFDREVDGLRQVLGAKKLMSVDQLRRGVEAIPEADYHRLSYYQRWMRSIVDHLLRDGVLTEAELRAALEAG